jgi:hypothetical protein
MYTTRIIAATIGPTSVIDLAGRPGTPKVNVNSRSTADLFAVLGLRYDGGVGQAPAADILGRVLIAQALLDVATTDEHGHPDGRGTCGIRRPKYLANRLGQLHQLATWAYRHHAVVAWS